MSEPVARDLSIVIPTRDRWTILQRTLDALRRQTVSGFEVIVVVDGGDQVPPDLTGVRVLAREHAGPGAARNAGATASERDLVLFLGDDMVPLPELVERHLAQHSRHPDREVAVLGNVAWHPEVADSRLLRWLDWSRSQFEFQSIEGVEAGFGHFYSCNVSLKRSFFLEAGGFDEGFVYYYEDLDCGRRLADRGMRLLFAPEALAHHLHRYAWDDVVRRFEGIAVGERMMAAKHTWFTPYFRQRVHSAAAEPQPSRAWPRLADLVPSSTPRLQRFARRRANTRYYQALEPAFTKAWIADEALSELKSYLGDSYDERRLQSHAHEVEREQRAALDEPTFYRTSEAYLYDLTVFAMSGTKLPYLRDLRETVGPPARLLDYGCGIGSDGLVLLDDEYDVSFADFDNPSTRYLRWRLDQRAETAPVYDIDSDTLPTDFDAVYSFDVIEHVADPFAFLGELERLGRIVAVNFLEPEPGDTDLHKPLPIDRLLDHVTDLGLLHYRRYHGRSHFVVYRSTPGGPLHRVRSRKARLIGSRR